MLYTISALAADSCVRSAMLAALAHAGVFARQVELSPLMGSGSPRPPIMVSIRTTDQQQAEDIRRTLVEVGCTGIDAAGVGRSRSIGA